MPTLECLLMGGESSDGGWIEYGWEFLPSHREPEHLRERSPSLAAVSPGVERC